MQQPLERLSGPAERGAALAGAIGGLLMPRDRTALVMRDGIFCPVALDAYEVRVAPLVVRGFENGEMAERLGCSESTVKFNLSNLIRKVEAVNRYHLPRRLIETGVVQVEPKEPIEMTPRSQEILALASYGKEPSEIGKSLGSVDGRKKQIAAPTVKSNLSQTILRFKAQGRTGAIFSGFEHGILTPDVVPPTAFSAEQQAQALRYLEAAYTTLVPAPPAS